MIVPRLTTALTGPLPDLERKLLQATPAIEHWLRSQWQEHPDDPGCPPNRFYAYRVIARLALLAAAVELERTESALEQAVQLRSAAAS